MKDLKIYTDNIEDEAVNQINLLLEQEAFKNCKVRIMPDVHAGAGCVIGFTADLGEKVIPNVVGVDIGCGMSWVKLKNKVNLEELDKTIKQYIPCGMNARENEILYTDIDLQDLFCYKELDKKNYLERSLGTLGGGNHFIEIDVDDEGNHYLVVHSGSRNLGKQVCEIYQNKAIEYCSFKKEMRKEKDKAIQTLKEQGKQYLIQQTLKDIEHRYEGKTKLPKDLCYIEGEDREKYLHDMKLCQKWASQNRYNIIDIIMNKLQIACDERHETIHNYISDDNIVRKGAISAQKGEVVLIPMNMRDGCIIAMGKGNVDWNCSAPHGAGRIMSRMKAKELLSVDEFKNSMNGIFTTTANESTIDEAPMVYKPMGEIVRNIGDTVDIIKIIKPIYNFKASE